MTPVNSSHFYKIFFQTIFLVLLSYDITLYITASLFAIWHLFLSSALITIS